LERTKEIGVLRAIGASKKDVGRVFNAETLIVGFVAGLIGILVTLALIVLINIILFYFTGIPNLQAYLPPVAAVVLVGISMFLTFIAGLFPAGFAAKRNPVEALRSE
jgi:putative ABC transport system permease protein